MSSGFLENGSNIDFYIVAPFAVTGVERSPQIVNYQAITLRNKATLERFSSS
jgi:hypothetical protein